MYVRLIRRLWRKQRAEYFFVAWRKPGESGIRDRVFRRDELDQLEDYLDQHRGDDVYWCPMGFSQPKRQEKYVVWPSMLWSDLDAVDPHSLRWKPSILWQSSPGRYAALWLVDQPINKELNKRMTYACGADKGGWDATQLLRIPGSRNYKYNKPKGLPGTLVWLDGPEYRLRDLERQVPRLDNGVVGDPEEAAEVYKKWEKKIPVSTRKMLFQKSVPVGERSEALFRMEHELMSTGMSIDEAVELLAASKWNKFTNRTDGGREQLHKEISKVITKKLSNGHTNGHTNGHKKVGPESDIVVHCMADVEAKEPNWLVHGLLVRGEITMLEGDPGVGKSYLALVLGIHLVDRKEFPTIRPYKKVRNGRVLAWDLENNRESVTRGRLQDNGIENVERYFQTEKAISWDDPEHLEKMDKVLEKYKPDLLIFDTLNTFMGNADTHKSSEVYQLLDNVSELIRKHNCACLMIRHRTKQAGKTKAIYAGQGSMGFAGRCRLIMAMASHPEDPDKVVMKVIKNNFGDKAPALVMHREKLPPTLRRQDRSRLVIEGWDYDIHEDELGAPVDKKKEKEKKTDDVSRAKEILETSLKKQGQVEVVKIERMAEARGIQRTVLHRASEQLGVVTKIQGKKGGGRATFWLLAGRSD